MHDFNSFSFKNKVVYFYLLLGISMLYIKNLSLFMIFCIIGGYVKYLRIKTRLPIIFEPIFFFAIVIAKSYPFYYVLFFLLTSNLIPEIMNLDFDIFSVIWILQLLFYCAIAVFLNIPLVQIGLLLSFLDMILSTAVHFALGDSPEMFSIAPISFLVINIVYFISLGNLIMTIMG